MEISSIYHQHLQYSEQRTLLITWHDYTQKVHIIIYFCASGTQSEELLIHTIAVLYSFLWKYKEISGPLQISRTELSVHPVPDKPACTVAAQLDKNFTAFVESEYSLPCSKQPNISKLLY